MENESVKSEPNSRSKRSRNYSSNSNNNNLNNTYNRDRNRHSHRSNNLNNTKGPQKSQRKNNTNNITDIQNPYHQTTVSMTGEENRDGQEIIEVQILPQDENWGENTTAITGNTSEQSISMEDINGAWHREMSETGFGFKCRRYLESVCSLCLGCGSFLSPIAMIIMPRMGFFPSAFDHPDLTQTVRTQLLACGSECKGLLISLTIRLLLLAIGVWALFMRRAIATMPRIFLYRALVMLLVTLSTFAYWLFYLVQVNELE